MRWPRRYIFLPAANLCGYLLTNFFGNSILAIAGGSFRFLQPSRRSTRRADDWTSRFLHWARDGCCWADNLAKKVGLCKGGLLLHGAPRISVCQRADNTADVGLRHTRKPRGIKDGKKVILLLSGLHSPEHLNSVCLGHDLSRRCLPWEK